MQLERIINETPLKPVIINKDSKFVIVTYWWGRGNFNKNTQKPCPDEVIPGKNLDKEPIKYNDMIDNWIKTCKKAKCNYLVQEYPEFAVPGGYQMAINAKPLFIKKAVESCEGRAVVYIDGDMTVNRYPNIFDMDNVDFMARGWNIDPRGNIHYLKKDICFDPFIFETSGGTMYFANSEPSLELLDIWAKSSAKEIFKGKADDRILSMIITIKKLYLRMNILQLPIEYLWLTDNYEPEDKKNVYLNKNHYDKKAIIFEHPACLTSEEKATEQGAAKNRQPKYYDQTLVDYIDCQTEGGIFWEYIIFEEKDKIWDKYLNYLSKAKLYKDEEGEIINPYYRIKYKNVYGGNRNEIAMNNVASAKNILKELRPMTSKLPKDMVYIQYSNELKFTSNILYTYDIIPTILALHHIGRSAVFLPNDYNKTDIKKVKTIKSKYKSLELIAKLIDDNEISPKIDNTFPIYLCCKSRILNHIVKMSENMEAFEKNLRLSAMFVQLIRCYFYLGIKSKKSLSKSSSKSNSKEVKSEIDSYIKLDSKKISRNIEALLSIEKKKKSTSKKIKSI